ncbi:spore coat protein U domain-containing protein [Lysobacter firmicutimachus]|uniref:Spore coat protein U domain-containing protein n=2 Tax=Lysobacter TaxID=68 RepID=A0ABU8CXD1_9GAMM
MSAQQSADEFNVEATRQIVDYERPVTRLRRWLGVSSTACMADGTGQSLTVYGRVAPQTATVGSYSDTITVLMTY